MINKIVPDAARRGMSLTPFEEAINDVIKKTIGKSSVSSYHLLKEWRDPFYDVTPTRIWRDTWKRPKETLR